MYTKTELAAKREVEAYKTDPQTILYTVSGVAFLLGVGRNSMKGLNIPKTRVHGTGKDWIRKCDLQAWLRTIAAHPDSEQAILLGRLRAEHHTKRVKKVSNGMLANTMEAPACLDGYDPWLALEETGRPIDDSTSDMAQQGSILLAKSHLDALGLDERTELTGTVNRLLAWLG